LIDIWKELYIPRLGHLSQARRQGAGSDMLFPEIHRQDATAYQKVVHAKAGISSVLLPIGQEVEISCYRRDGAWSA
jgi:hypothetical protein